MPRPEAVVLASSNPNKAREFEAIMGGITVEAMPAGFTLPEETGSTFYENARLKADSVRRQFLERAALLEQGKQGDDRTGPPWVMADDSGIEVEALGGAPGIYSSRFAGEEASDEDNLRKVLSELEGMKNRKARFVCELVLLDPEGRELRGTGVFEGKIADGPRGSSGFGYDPVFIPTGSGLTVSQIPAEEKNRISHRARAVHHLLAHFGGGRARR